MIGSSIGETTSIDNISKRFDKLNALLTTSRSAKYREAAGLLQEWAPLISRAEFIRLLLIFDCAAVREYAEGVAQENVECKRIEAARLVKHHGIW